MSDLLDLNIFYFLTENCIISRNNVIKLALAGAVQGDEMQKLLKIDWEEFPLFIVLRLGKIMTGICASVWFCINNLMKL